MQTKEFLSIILLFILIFIGLGAMSLNVNYGADLDVVRDFDNTTIYHTVKSDAGSQKVSGIENNAKLVTTGQGSQKTIETDDGYYEYSFLSDENGVRLNSTDRVKFNVNRTLTANYDFTPYMNAEIDVIDLHGHSGSSSTYPAMKHTGDSITKTFKEYTDVETGYTPLYILDLDTMMKYQPGDKFTITYNDVLSTGLNKIIKTFQYVYAKDIVIENITYVNKTVEVPFYKIIVIPEIIIEEFINSELINQNTDKYNETNTDKVLNNNTTNTNNITSNINKENNNDTYTSDNTKTVTMEKTGNDTVGAIFLIILFIILIQLYRREDD